MKTGNLQRVQDLIQNWAEVNAWSKSGTDTMLTEAIWRSHEDIALALLEAGADVHVKDITGQTPLHLACKRGLEKVVQALIDRGGRVDVADADGLTPLSLCAGDIAISMHLLRAGANCIGSVSKGRMDELLRHACCVDEVLAVETMLKNGCSVDALSKEEQEKLLHSAYYERNLLVVRALFKNGCSVTLSAEEQNMLLRYASHEGDTFIAWTLIRNGRSVSTLSREQQEMLLRCACRDSNLLVAEILFKVGCSLFAVSREDQVTLLQCACSEGNVLVLEALIACGCSVDCVYADGLTPIMVATREGHEEVVKKLILADANLTIQDEHGSTALHYAAICNHIQCGILLVEGGASVSTRNKYSETPLGVAKADFHGAMTQALSFTTRKTLCIIGNAEGGKSTLIASLQAERTSSFGRLVNRFKRVDDCLKRTAGIETVPYNSQKYGEVLFFDFAGQDDYHGPHQMFLEALLSKPGVSMTLLLVIKVTEAEETILHQLHRWLTPVALMSSPASPPHVIVIGSFLDKVKSKREATSKLIRCTEETERDLEELPVRFVGTCFLNCRQPQSEGIDQLCNFLQEVPVPEFRATYTCYSLAWVIFQIRSSIEAPALQLQEFSIWVKGNEDNLPRTIPTPEEICQDLSAAGHALYLPNKEDPLKSWLVLDLPGILHDVYGNLFSHSKKIVNDFGLLHCQCLAKHFPHVELEMVQQLLISLEFCIPVDPSVLKIELSKLTQSEETSGWLFFPSLISAKPQLTTGSKQSVCSLCWQLRTSKKHIIYARILQTILLRLAAHFVVKHRNEEGVPQHCCHIWWNGIAWQSTVGVDVTVHITNNRVIQVIATSEIADKLCQYLTHVVSDILSTVNRVSPKLAAAAYIVYPPDKATSPEHIIGIPPKELFPVEGIQNSVREQDGFVLSLKDCDNSLNRISVPSAFGGHTPSLEDVQKLIWPQPEANQPQSCTEVKGAQAFLDISSPPDMRALDELVVTGVAANWQRLALRLGVEGCVSEIVFKNHPNDYEGACRDMLDRWLRGDRHTGEEERTWSTLLTALDRAGFAELERSLRREHFTSQ